jgi:hypothetical protein
MSGEGCVHTCYYICHRQSIPQSTLLLRNMMRRIRLPEGLVSPAHTEGSGQQILLSRDWEPQEAVEIVKRPWLCYLFAEECSRLQRCNPVDEGGCTERGAIVT